MRISPRNIPSTKLQIRQEDIHSILKQMHSLRGLDRPRIVHDWYVKPLLSGFPHCLDDLRNIMCRCHKINIVGFLSLKLKKYLSQPIYCDDFSRLFNSLMAYFIRRCRQFTIPMAYFTRCFRQLTSPMAYFLCCPIRYRLFHCPRALLPRSPPPRNFAVLAKHAPQRTPDKKHRPRALLTGDTGFFPHMKSSPRDDQLFGLSTTACSILHSIHSARSRAESAVLKYHNYTK